MQLIMCCRIRKRILIFVKIEINLLKFLGEIFFEKLEAKKESLRLYLSLLTFQAQCLVIKDLLMNKNLFGRVYELRKKFRYLIKNAPQNKNVVQRDLWAYVEERLYGFDIVRKPTENEKKELFKPIGIVYKPVSKVNQIINCYFSKSMRNAYRAISDKKGKESTTVEQCYACNKFFIQKKSLERHLIVCGHLPGIIYKFENRTNFF